MKSKVLLIVLVLIIVALLIILGITLFKKEPKDPTLEETQPMEAQEIWIPEDHSLPGRDIVREHIAEIEKELAEMSGDGPLSENHINRICTFFQDRGYMCKDNGKPAKNVGAIRAYLNQISERTERIEFKLVYFVSEELTHILKKPPSEQRPEDIIHVVQLGLRVSYVFGEGSFDPPGGRDEYHIRDCTWITS